MKNSSEAEMLERLVGRVRGRVTFKKPMKPITWLRVGGEAEIFFQPHNTADLSDFLSYLPSFMDVTPIGVCSNLLVSDDGIPGVTIRLGREFTKMHSKDNQITVGAGMLDSKVASFAARNGIDMSFLRTIPGTIGGAVKMNAGCYGNCIEDIFVNAEVVLRSGEVKVLTRDDLDFSYRKSNLPERSIITRVTLQSVREHPNVIEAKMKENQEKRGLSQPIREKTGGSTFKNPSANHSYDGRTYSAWELIEKAQLRGAKVGGAQVSKLHANFLINTGNASAQDFNQLGEMIQTAVFEESGIRLEWEIKKLGIF